MRLFRTLAAKRIWYVVLMPLRVKKLWLLKTGPMRSLIVENIKDWGTRSPRHLSAIFLVEASLAASCQDCFCRFGNGFGASFRQRLFGNVWLPLGINAERIFKKSSVQTLMFTLRFLVVDSVLVFLNKKNQGARNWTLIGPKLDRFSKHILKLDHVDACLSSKMYFG